jgi:hypothetical protein
MAIIMRYTKRSRGLVGLLGLATLGACATGWNEDAAQEHEGKLLVQAGILLDGSTVTRYVLRSDSGAEIELDFGTAPKLDPRATLRVRGHTLADGRLEVEEYERVERKGQVATLREAVITPGPRQMAMLMVHWNGPDATTPAQIEEQLFTSTGSAAALYAEASYGKRSFGGAVFDWLQIPAPSNCNIGEIANAADAAAAAAGIDLSSYQHVGYFVSATSACNFSAFGDVGVPAAPARRTWYNASFPPSLLVHELGHNLGFWHAHSYQCGSAIGPQPMCSFFAEYGDPYDPMASSTAHFNAYAKMAQGWFENCGAVTATRDAVFTLSPTESSSSGVQAVRVPLAAELCPPVFPNEPPGIGGPCYYYIEHRQPIGFDGVEPFTSAPMHDGVLVHTDVGVDNSGNSGLTGSSILDMTPGSTHANGPFWDANLGAGRVFGDPTGVRIRVISQAGQNVRVAVKVPGGTAAPTCLDGSAAPSTASCNNGVLNAGETDVDCGGTSCVPCNDGKACAVHADCWSDNCVGGVCAIACDDGAKNGSETDLDCGGSCSDCGIGQNCNVNGDCGSNRCTGEHFCTSQQLTAVLNVHSNWSTGFCGSLTLTNTGSTPTVDWSAFVNFTDSTFTNTSGATFTPVGNGLQRITPTLPWGNIIWPSSNAVISFCATKTGPGYAPEFLFNTVRY